MTRRLNPIAEARRSGINPRSVEQEGAEKIHSVASVTSCETGSRALSVSSCETIGSRPVASVAVDHI